MIELNKAIEQRKAIVGIIGMGYVGLPLSLLFVQAGFKVVGFDINESYVQELQQGKSRIIDVADEELQQALATQGLLPTTEEGRLAEADIFIICVPTPLNKTRQPDLSYIEQACSLLTRIAEPGRLIVLESTTYPGTTDELLLPMLSQSSMRIDRDFLLAFSSERVDPGNRAYPLAEIPKVVGGVTPASTRAAIKLYETVFKVHPVSSARAAELSKLLENTFRNVNIALANEFAQICNALGADVWEVIEAAKTKPFGFMAFYPGPGIGGHCIPLDPHYLVYRSRLSGYEPRLVTLADQINQEMPLYTVHKIMDLLNGQGKALSQSRVLVLGVAYKPDVPDVRESPAVPVIEGLLERGAGVSYCDPYVAELPLGAKRLLRAVPFSRAVLAEADVVVVLTAHTSIDYELVSAFADKLLDTRHVVPLVQLKCQGEPASG